MSLRKKKREILLHTGHAGESSRGLSLYKLQHANFILLPESKLPPARRTQDVHVIACLHLHVLCALVRLHVALRTHTHTQV